MNSVKNFDKCIIDVGCWHNGVRGKLLKKKSGLPVIFIDANQDVLDKLEIEDDDIKICAALSSRSGITKFNIYPYDETSSVCDINLNNVQDWIINFRNSRFEEWVTKEIRMVPMLCLEDIIESLNIQSVAALKIDGQGHDYQILLGLKESINLVEYIELEVQTAEKELYQGSSKKNEVIQYLKKFGFVLIQEKNQTHNQEQNLIFYNEKKLHD